MASKHGRQHGPFVEVELSVSARKIRNRDLLSISDPMCIMYTKRPCSDVFVEHGRTESVKDDIDPDFVTKLKIDYFHKEKQILKFELYDKDSPSGDLRRHDYLGHVICTLEDIVENKRIERPIEYKTILDRKGGGTLILSADEVGERNDIVTLQFRAEDLDKMDWFGKADPYLVFYRTNPDKSTTIVHRTEILLKTLNPTWEPFRLPLRTLCAEDFDSTIYISCWDWNQRTRDVCIGRCEMTLSELKQRRQSSTNFYKLINFEKKETSTKYDNSGKLFPVSYTIEKRYSLQDYVKSGLRIHFTVALHVASVNGSEMRYEKVLTALRQSIEYFDKTRSIRTLGFGATNQDHKEPDVFFLNGATNPCCEDVSGVIASYRQTLASYTATGEADVAPVLKYVEKFARDHNDDNTYFVAIILIAHVDTTTPSRVKEAIKQVSPQPISIIIVAVGNDNDDIAGLLKEIEAEDDRPNSEGERPAKHVINFVCLQDFLDEKGDVFSEDRLAREVFRKMPDQCLHWMTENQIKPRYA
ncbi:copine-5-like [Ptychodera flava]|uniref:copine-5-like n=1 Tax=Ptychodera flava TaxID=63121 RepID=UPI00396A1499